MVAPSFLIAEFSAVLLGADGIVGVTAASFPMRVSVCRDENRAFHEEYEYFGNSVENKH